MGSIDARRIETSAVETELLNREIRLSVTRLHSDSGIPGLIAFIRRSGDSGHIVFHRNLAPILVNRHLDRRLGNELDCTLATFGGNLKIVFLDGYCLGLAPIHLLLGAGRGCDYSQGHEYC